MNSANETIRRRFILSASAGLALAIVCGFPIGGWLAENHSTEGPTAAAATHLAIAGVNRGLHELQDKRIDFDALARGRTLPGYDNDVAYRDAAGGVYRVRARYDAGKGEVHMTGVGAPTGSSIRRAVEMTIKPEAGAGRWVQVAWREVQP